MAETLNSVHRIEPKHVTDPVQPEVYEAEGSTICHLRKTPEVITGILVELLRSLYSPGNGMSVEKEWRWEGLDTAAREGATAVWINAEAVWNDNAPDYRPAMYVVVNPISYGNTGNIKRGMTHMDLEAGEYHYSRSGKGSVDIVHIGRTQGESQALVSNTLDLMDAFSDVVRREFCFSKFAVVQVAPSKPAKKESRERFSSMLKIAYEFTDEFVLKLESPKLQRIVFNAGLKAAGTLELEAKIL